MLLVQEVGPPGKGSFSPVRRGLVAAGNAASAYDEANSSACSSSATSWTNLSQSQKPEIKREESEKEKYGHPICLPN